MTYLLTKCYTYESRYYTLFGNEVLSLMITHGLSYIIPLSNYFIIYFYYFISFMLIYLIIGYRIRQTDEVLIVDEVVDSGINKIVGLTLINTNDKLIYYKVNSKYKFKKNY